MTLLECLHKTRALLADESKWCQRALAKNDVIARLGGSVGTEVSHE